MLKYIIILILCMPLSCNAQTIPSDKIVGGPCEGCEAIFEYGGKKLVAVDTLPLFLENEPKLKITGKVYQKDSTIPAADVIIYIYHTNRKGIYQTRGDEIGWARRHGFIRGWVQTDVGGNYTFYTFRPAAYPSRDEPEHIHITVKEPGKTEYYLDEFVFADDPILTEELKGKLDNRGGSGIMKPTLEDGMLTIYRELILGLNIPDYE